MIQIHISQQQSNQLIITSVQSTDAGRYICVCQTPDGQQYESEYELTVETPPVRNEVKPPQIEYAEVGSGVVLHCNPDRFTSRYHWSRQQGHFAPGTDISSVSFTFNEHFEISSFHVSIHLKILHFAS